MLKIDDYSHSRIKHALDNVDVVVLKLGTSLLTSTLTSKKQQDLFFRSFVKQVKLLKKYNKKVIIVSSGAVGLGRNLIKEYEYFLNEISMLNSLEAKQGLASIGQVELMEMYRHYFQTSDILVSQILLTRNDFEKYESSKNLYSTFHLLLKWGIVPIVNENDTISDEELLPLGDNDTLSLLVTKMFSKSMLVIFTNVDGFYVEEELLRIVFSISPELKKEAGTSSAEGTGGMITKISTAENLLECGKTLFLTNGKNVSKLSKLFFNKTMNDSIYQIKGTWFTNDF